MTPTTTDPTDPTLAESDWTRSLPPPPRSAGRSTARPAVGAGAGRSSLLVIGVPSRRSPSPRLLSCST